MIRKILISGEWITYTCERDQHLLDLTSNYGGCLKCGAPYREVIGLWTKGHKENFIS